MMNLQKLAAKAKFFSGFSDQTRLSIVETLADGPKNVGEIAKATGQPQPNVSNHLACLLECGLVRRERKGKCNLYSLSEKDVEHLLAVSEKIVAKHYGRLAACTKP